MSERTSLWQFRVYRARCCGQTRLETFIFGRYVPLSRWR